MAEGEGALGSAEGVVAEGVVVGFVGDDLDLPVDALKEVAFDHDVGVGVGLLARADAQGFVAVAVTRGPVDKVVVVDLVVGRFSVEPDNQGDPRVVLVDQTVVVGPVVFAVERNPEVAFFRVGGVVGFDHTVGKAAVTGVLPEPDDVARSLERSVVKVQPVDDQVLAGND